MALELDDFARTALLERAERLGVAVDEFVARALRHLLAEHDAGRAAARVPLFRRSAGPERAAREPLQLAPKLDEGSWRALRRHGEEQGVSLSTLVEHAALLLIADLDRGRVQLAAGEGVASGGANLGPRPAA